MRLCSEQTASPRQILIVCRAIAVPCLVRPSVAAVWKVVVCRLGGIPSPKLTARAKEKSEPAELLFGPVAVVIFI